MDFVLRRATPSDAAAIAEVYVSSWNEGFVGLMSPRVLDRAQVDRWRLDLRDDARRWWLAGGDHSVVGFIGIGPSRDPVDPAIGEVDTIAVAPSAWRHGIGRRLMSVAVSGLGDVGYREGILWTLAGYRQGNSFYEATGWRASGETRDAGRQIAFRRSLETGPGFG